MKNKLTTILGVMLRAKHLLSDGGRKQILRLRLRMTSVEPLFAFESFFKDAREAHERWKSADQTKFDACSCFVLFVTFVVIIKCPTARSIENLNVLSDIQLPPSFAESQSPM